MISKSDPSDDHQSADTAAQSGSLPLLPGTEEPRSLGDLIRKAGAVSESTGDKQGSIPGSAISAASAEPSMLNEAGRESESCSRASAGRRPSRSRARRNARERALQAVYSWDVSGDGGAEVLADFLATQDMSRVDLDYFKLLYEGAVEDVEQLDKLITQGLDRPLDNLDPVERSILRIATLELIQCPDVPQRVVINEYVEITKRFGADQGHRYINGVLDTLAKEHRAGETRT